MTALRIQGTRILRRILFFSSPSSSPQLPSQSIRYSSLHIPTKPATTFNRLQASPRLLPNTTTPTSVAAAARKYNTMPGSEDLEMEGVNQTVYPPPPINPVVAPIENTLELRVLSELGEDVFTNTRPQWHPPGARGIYGGSVIAQSLAAALKSVPPDLVVHSMHCYFVLAGDSRRPVFFHVERVREGRSFATRTVQARQRGKILFTATCSFQRPSGGRRCLRHEQPMPEGLKDPENCQDGLMIAGEMLKKGLITKEFWDETKRRAAEDPFERRLIEIKNEFSDTPHSKRMRSWVRAKGRINAPLGAAPHYEALAYLSDSWFIGTVSRAHKTRDVGMMVSLDHTIYFHRPFRADEWMLMESDTPWAGDQRGFVHQRIMDLKGNLVATCFQEGLIRMKDVKDEGVEHIANSNGGSSGDGEGVKRESKL